MKKKIIMLVIAVIITMQTLVLSSCSCSIFGRHTIHYGEGFEYIIVGKNSNFPSIYDKAVVAIVGISMYKEAIDIPRVIDGMEVRHIGYHDLSYFSDFGYRLESDKLKKLYLHDNIVSIHKDAFLYWQEGKISLDIMLSGVDMLNGDVGNNLNHGLPSGSLLYLYREVYEQRYSSFGNSSYRPANVAFLNNYSDEVNGGYYRLDNIDSGEKIPTVPNPEREGYSFTGWYTEPGCINAWDFDVPPTIEDDTEFRLYAGWQTK